MAAQQGSARSRPDWSSGLPSEILESIRDHLASGTDAASFRSVCSPWRAAVPFAPCFAPLLLLPFSPDSDAATLYSVAEDKAFSVKLPHDLHGGKVVPCGSSCGWLALMDAYASVTLFNPFTGARVELPPADADIAAASTMFVSKDDDGRWVFDSDDEYGNMANPGEALTLNDMRQVFFNEIIELLLLAVANRPSEVLVLLSIGDLMCGPVSAVERISFVSLYPSRLYIGLLFYAHNMSKETMAFGRRSAWQW